MGEMASRDSAPGRQVLHLGRRLTIRGRSRKERQALVPASRSSCTGFVLGETQRVRSDLRSRRQHVSDHAGKGGKLPRGRGAYGEDGQVGGARLCDGAARRPIGMGPTRWNGSVYTGRERVPQEQGFGQVTYIRYRRQS